jgi:hypothetical protein
MDVLKNDDTAADSAKKYFLKFQRGATVTSNASIECEETGGQKHIQCCALGFKDMTVVLETTVLSCSYERITYDYFVGNRVETPFTKIAVDLALLRLFLAFYHEVHAQRLSPMTLKNGNVVNCTGVPVISGPFFDFNDKFSDLVGELTIGGKSKCTIPL